MSIHSVLIVMMILVEVLMVAGIWTTLVKAGKPGWGGLVPGYNLYLLIRIANCSGIWLLYCLLPVANLLFIMIVYRKICQNFGVPEGFAFGMLILPFVFFPLLGFGTAQYQPEFAK